MMPAMTPCLSKRLKRCSLIYPVLVLICFAARPSCAQEDQRAVSIHLINRVYAEEPVYKVHRIAGKEIHALEYMVRKGDCLWKILKKHGLWNRRNRSEILSLTRKLNRSPGNLDLIHPGQALLIPLRIMPFPEAPSMRESSPAGKPQNLEFRSYRVKRGDTLSAVVRDLYDIPSGHLYNEYLAILKKMNPRLKNLNLIYPGQRIRLPVYSSRSAQGPMKPVSIQEKPQIIDKSVSSCGPGNPLTDDLEKIFTQMGENWVGVGEHFVPLRSGGLMKLKAGSFPLVHLRNGRTLILDVNHRLPHGIKGLVEAQWPNYRVVRLSEKDSLRTALTRIFSVCSYPGLLKEGEPLELKGSLVCRITGDWIVCPSTSDSSGWPDYVVVNVAGPRSSRLSPLIRNYLKRSGIRIIDLTGENDDPVQGTDPPEVLEAGPDRAFLIRALLNLAALPYHTGAEISVYRSDKNDFSLSLKADFLLRVNGKDGLIDLTGLAPEMRDLLEEHGFLLLSLAGEKDPMEMVAGTLRFINAPFSPGPLSLVIAEWDDTRKISLTIPGITFSDPSGGSVMVTPAALPAEIAAYLSQKGYKILALSPLSDAGLR